MCTKYIMLAIKIIEQSVMSYMEDNGILGEVPGAFRRDRRTEDSIFTLQGIKKGH
jgi:hypothetical protein